jgi:hypothetical protein
MLLCLLKFKGEVALKRMYNKTIIQTALWKKKNIINICKIRISLSLPYRIFLSYFCSLSQIYTKQTLVYKLLKLQ